MIYKNMYDDEGNEVTSRKLVFITTEDDGTINSTTSSQSLAVNRTGFVYVVDEVVLNNIDKFEVINGNLQLRDGETLEEPVKSDLEIEEEELLRRIAEIQAQKQANTEESTDEPAE